MPTLEWSDVHHDSWRDVAEGMVGGAGIAFDLLTPFLRPIRSHWGLDAATASRRYPGDDLVTEPLWGWTHGLEVDATPEDVWPWVAQIGADRGGFYSYQWLENLVGCGVRNADAVHPEWAHGIGSTLALHPDMPGLPVVEVEPPRHLLAHGSGEPGRDGGRWTNTTWLFLVEPLGEAGRGPTRVISRFRTAYPEARLMRILVPYLTEATGFVMDRRMLLGIRERAVGRRD